MSAISWMLECVLFGYTVHRFGVLGALPVAHERVFREIELGMVTGDGQGCVVAANEAALDALGLERGGVCGRELRSLSESAFRVANARPGDPPLQDR